MQTLFRQVILIWGGCVVTVAQNGKYEFFADSGIDNLGCYMI